MNESMFNELIESPELLQMKLMNKHRNMTNCSNNFENSESSLNTTISPSAVQEPHTSWRFYTSYDNGEWKRHCVPVYHSEDDILQNNKHVAAVANYDAPHIESSLRRMRLGRPALHESIQRRRMANENKYIPSYDFQHKVSHHRGYPSEPNDYGLYGSSSYYGNSPHKNNYITRSNSISYSSSSTKPGISNYSGANIYDKSRNHDAFSDYGVYSDINIEDIKSKILSNKTKTKNFSERVIVPTKYKTADELALENEKADALKEAKRLEKNIKNGDEDEINFEKSLVIRKATIPGKDVKVVIVNKDIDNTNKLFSNHDESFINNSPAYTAQKAGKEMMHQLEKHVKEQLKEKFPLIDDKNAIKEKQEMYTETLNVWNGDKQNQETTVCEAKYESNNPITGSQNISERIVCTNQDSNVMPLTNNIYNSYSDSTIMNQMTGNEVGKNKIYKSIEPYVDFRIDSLEKVIIPRKYKEATNSENLAIINNGEIQGSYSLTKTLNNNFSHHDEPIQKSYNMQANNFSTGPVVDFANDSDSVSLNVSTKDFKSGNMESYSNNLFGERTTGRIVHEENGEKIIIPRKYQQSSIGESNSSQTRVGFASLSGSIDNDLSLSFGLNSSNEYQSFPSIQHNKPLSNLEYQHAIY